MGSTGMTILLKIGLVLLTHSGLAASVPLATAQDSSEPERTAQNDRVAIVDYRN